MLVLSRKAGEKVLVGEVDLVVIAIKGRTVKLGFAGDRKIAITRAELANRLKPRAATC